MWVFSVRFSLSTCLSTLFICLSVCLSSMSVFCLFIYRLFIYISSVCLFLCLSIFCLSCPSIYRLFIYLSSVCISIVCLFVCLSTDCLSVYLSFICLFVCLSDFVRMDRWKKWIPFSPSRCLSVRKSVCRSVCVFPPSLFLSYMCHKEQFWWHLMTVMLVLIDNFLSWQNYFI